MDRYLDEFTESHINHNCGSILDQLNEEDQHGDEYPDVESEEPWDGILEQQELEDYERADEYFGYYGGDDEG